MRSMAYTVALMMLATLCSSGAAGPAAAAPPPPSTARNASAPAAPFALPLDAGRVMAQKAGTWYSHKVSSPVVIRFAPDDWRMWAYGREVDFSPLYPNWSFGRSGYFVSSDGVHWEPVAGPGHLGSAMDPRRGSDRFDGGATGVSDVVYIGGVFFAFITGGRDAELHPGDRSPPAPAGGAFGARGFQRSRLGAAASRDGIHWARCDADRWRPGAFGATLSFGDLDLTPVLGHVYAEGYDPASDPVKPPPPRGAQGGGGGGTQAALAEGDCRALLAAAAGGRQFGPRAPRRPGAGAGGGAAALRWELLYNSLTLPPCGAPGVRLFGGAAAPPGQLFFFEKTGLFRPGALAPAAPGAAAFDGRKVSGGRKVKLPGRKEWLLFYEGADESGAVSIGQARSADGRGWVKEDRCAGVAGVEAYGLARGPGGPTLAPRWGEWAAWDSIAVGTPFPLPLPNGTLLLYYVGFTNATRLPGAPPGEGGLGAAVGLAAAEPERSGAYCRFRRVTL
ncbi:MAG: hypothetical protein J3K34DRAFT_462708 [Monoraphidium minutum]|nr:MAG: hypothetical protein J3K34DRAFT_462708 [Monoraphidium minutum]